MLQWCLTISQNIDLSPTLDRLVEPSGVARTRGPLLDKSSPLCWTIWLGYRPSLSIVLWMVQSMLRPFLVSWAVGNVRWRGGEQQPYSYQSALFSKSFVSLSLSLSIISLSLAPLCLSVSLSLSLSLFRSLVFGFLQSNHKCFGHCVCKRPGYISGAL